MFYAATQGRSNELFKDSGIVWILESFTCLRLPKINSDLRIIRSSRISNKKYGQVFILCEEVCCAAPMALPTPCSTLSHFHFHQGPPSPCLAWNLGATRRPNARVTKDAPIPIPILLLLTTPIPISESVYRYLRSLAILI